MKKMRSICLRMDEDLANRIMERILVAKLHHINISQNKWIVSAMEEKLDREAKKMNRGEANGNEGL